MTTQVRYNTPKQEMTHVRVSNRTNPVRSGIISQQTSTPLPSNHRPNVTVKPLPILQPPTFLKKPDKIYENQNKQENKKYNSPTIVNVDPNRKVTQQGIIRFPVYIPQQAYSKQSNLPLSTRPIRHTQPKYSINFYST